MGYDGSIKFDTKIDDSKLRSQMQGLQSKIAALSKTLQFVGVTASIAAVTRSMINLGKASISASSDAQETANKFKVVFSEISQASDRAVKDLVDNYGKSQRGAMEALAGTADLLEGLGATQEQALKASKTISTYAVDLSSYTNVVGGAERAQAALNSLFVGEREAIKAYGQSIQDVDLKKFAEDQGKAYKELSKFEKGMLSLEYSMIQGENAFGDFKRSSDSYANVTRVATSTSEDFHSALGERLIPTATRLKEAYIGITEALTEYLQEKNKLYAAEEAAANGTETTEQKTTRLAKTLQELKSANSGVVAELERLKAGLERQEELGYSISESDKKRLADLQSINEASQDEIALIISQIRAIEQQSQAEKELSAAVNATTEATNAAAEAERKRRAKLISSKEEAVESYNEELKNLKTKNELGIISEKDYTNERLKLEQQLQDDLIELGYNGARGDQGDKLLNESISRAKEYASEIKRIEEEAQAGENKQIISGDLSDVREYYLERQQMIKQTALREAEANGSTADERLKLLEDLHAAELALLTERTNKEKAAKTAELTEAGATASQIAYVEESYNLQVNDFKKKQADETADYQIQAEKRAAKLSAESWEAYVSEIGNALSALAGDDSTNTFAGLASSASSVVGLIASGGADLNSWAGLIDGISSLASEMNLDSFEEFQEDLEALGNAIIDSLAPAFDILFTILSLVVDPIAEIMSAIAPLIEIASQLIVALISANPLFTLLNSAMKLIAVTMEAVASVILTLYNNIVVPVGNLLISVFNKVGGAIWAIFSGIYDALIVPVGNLIISAFNVIGEAVANIFNVIYTYVIAPIANGIIAIFNGVIFAINSVLSALNAALGWLGVNFGLLDSVSYISTSGIFSFTAATQLSTGALGEFQEAAYLTAISLDDTTDSAEEAAQALDDANEELAENIDLLTNAKRATELYDIELTSVIDSVSDFYESLQDVGSDISDILIDSLVDGMDGDDFLYAIEQYITEAVIQAAVFTDSFTAEIAEIGTALAQAIASGADASTIASLKDRLASLYEEAATAAQAATAVVTSAFGSYDVGTISVNGDQLANIHDSEMILPAGIAEEARSAGIYIGAPEGLTSNSTTVNVIMDSDIAVDGEAIGRIAWEYSDKFAGAAYGV